MHHPDFQKWQGKRHEATPPHHAPCRRGFFCAWPLRRHDTAGLGYLLRFALPFTLVVAGRPVARAPPRESAPRCVLSVHPPPPRARRRLQVWCAGPITTRQFQSRHRESDAACVLCLVGVELGLGGKRRQAILHGRSALIPDERLAHWIAPSGRTHGGYTHTGWELPAEGGTPASAGAGDGGGEE